MTMTTKPNPGGGGGGGGTADADTDRISELPIEILHRILGFLEMDELLIQTSLVSTKWRNLWKSVSNLKFTRCRSRRSSSSSSSRRTDDDDDSVFDNGGIRNNVEKYQNFVDHVLRLRDDSEEASKIEIFSYNCYDSNSKGGRRGGYDYLERLHNFIVNAVNQGGAQEIQIEGCHSDGISNNGGVHFNPSIFTSGLLRKFTFRLFNNYLIQFPRSMCCATQLTHLILYSIRLPEGDDSSNAAADELHLVCPILEKLVMHRCYSKHLKLLDISAPRLETLTICNACMRFRDIDGLGGCRIEIRTPNLTSLTYSGCVYVDCFTENLPRLAFANLNFTMETGILEQTTSFAIKLLKGLSSANSLILKGFEDFSQDTLKMLLTPFTSLGTLELVTTCAISSIHGMVHILNSCNSIERLVWEVDKYYTVEGDERWMLPQCRLSHLTHVHIKRLRGHENEIDFVKFLLKSYVVLEDIIINTARYSPTRSIEENLKQFIEEEPSVRRSIKLHIL